MPRRLRSIGLSPLSLTSQSVAARSKRTVGTALA
jgi:hypothetical protein